MNSGQRWCVAVIVAGPDGVKVTPIVDPTKLAGAGLAMSDVSDALTANNSNGGGGFIARGFYSEGEHFFS